MVNVAPAAVLPTSNVMPGPVMPRAAIVPALVFDPRTLGNLALWLDARFPNGFGGSIPADGTALSQWNDLSGNGRHATQGTGANQPLFRSANPNLLTYNQATVETDTTGLSIRDGSPTLARSTAQAAHGSASLAMTTSAAGLQAIGTSGSGTAGFPVVAGGTYTAHAAIRSAAVSRSGGIYIVWYTAGGGYLSTSYTTAITTSTSAWVTGTVTATAPAGATYADMRAGVADAAGASEVHYFDCFGLWGGSSTTWVPPVTLPAGMPVVQFDGVNDILSATIPALTDSQGITAYWVAARETTPFAASPRVFGVTGGSNFEHFMDFSNNKYYARAGTAISLLGPSTADALFHVASHVVASTAHSGYLDGSSSFSGVSTGSVTTGTTMNVGNSGGTPGQWRFGALLIYTTAHDATTRQRIERALGRIYGVTVA